MRFLGGTAELLGLYIVIVAGTRVLPQWLRFKDWKRWMRAELMLWSIVVLTGEDDNRPKHEFRTHPPLPVFEAQPLRQNAGARDADNVASQDLNRTAKKRK